jgi:hypothetical protein
VQLISGKLWDQPVQTLTVNMQGSGDSLRASMKVQSSAGNGTGTLRYVPRSQGYDLALDLHATNLSNIAMLRARNIQAQGGATLAVHGRGTLSLV